MKKTKTEKVIIQECEAIGCRNKLNGMRTLCLHCLKRVEKMAKSPDDPISQTFFAIISNGRHRERLKAVAGLSKKLNLKPSEPSSRDNPLKKEKNARKTKLRYYQLKHRFLVKNGFKPKSSDIPRAKTLILQSKSAYDAKLMKLQLQNRKSRDQRR